MEVSEQIERLRREIEDYQAKVRAQEEELEFLSNDLESQYQAKLEKVSDLREEVKRDEEELKKALRLKESWANSIEEWRDQ